MLIKIKTTDKDLEANMEPTIENEMCGYVEVVDTLVGALDAYCNTFLESLDEGEIQAVHDYMSAVFSKFMLKCFPDTTDFGLSDAAMIMAQDQLIEEAAKEDVPLEEVIARYNERAQEYYKGMKYAGKMS